MYVKKTYRNRDDENDEKQEQASTRDDTDIQTHQALQSELFDFSDTYMLYTKNRISKNTSNTRTHQQSHTHNTPLLYTLFTTHTHIHKSI